MQALALNLLSFIPGAGPLVAGVSAFLRCVPCMVLAAVLAAGGYGYGKGHRAAAAACNAAALRQELANARRDLDLANELANAARESRDRAEAEQAALNDQLETISDANKKLPACIRGRDRTERLLNLGR